MRKYRHRRAVPIVVKAIVTILVDVIPATTQAVVAAVIRVPLTFSLVGLCLELYMFSSHNSTWYETQPVSLVTEWSPLHAAIWVKILTDPFLIIWVPFPCSSSMQVLYRAETAQMIITRKTKWRKKEHKLFVDISDSKSRRRRVKSQRFVRHLFRNKVRRKEESQGFV